MTHRCSRPHARSLVLVLVLILLALVLASCRSKPTPAKSAQAPRVTATTLPAKATAAPPTATIVAHGNAAADGDGDPADGAAHGNLCAADTDPAHGDANPGADRDAHADANRPADGDRSCRLPAATATPDAASVKVNADIINVRSGPGTAYPVIGRLDGGATQKIVGKSEDGKWWQIATKEGTGWVAGELVTADGPMRASLSSRSRRRPPPHHRRRPPAAVGGPAPRPSGGGSFGYGIQIDPWGDRGAAIGAIKNMGFNWVKFQLPWKDFEGQRGQRNWPDDIIGDLNGNGLNVLVSIVKAPDWARPGNTDRSVEGPPADPGTYASFVGEFAARYCGRVQAIEVWNEQNLDYEWGREPLDPARYVRLLAAAYGAIKRACPSTVVVSGALTPTGAPPPVAMDDFTYLERMYQAGLKNYADAIGAHPSGFNVAPDVPGGAPACDFIRGQGSLYVGPCNSPHHSWSFRSTMEGYRNIMLRYGDGNKRIWPTEFGWAAGWTGQTGLRVRQGQHAR